MTSKRLRKHLATISQLFSMNDQDIEQLSTFMGHSVGVHRSEYRLPDDIFQTAKVMKMLIMMENGTAGQFKGKSFDEIDFNLLENLLEPNPNSELNVSSDEGDDQASELTNEHFVQELLSAKPSTGSSVCLDN